MAISSRGSRRVPISLRRRTAWDIGPGTTSGGQTLSSTASIIGGFGTAALSDGMTLVRTRGELVLNLITAAAANNGFVGAFGCGIATSPAFAVGSTAVPMPIDEEGWDGWLYHRYFHILSSSILAGAVSGDADAMNAMTAVLRVEVDSKAMRKLSIDETIFCALQVTEVGTATGLWQYNSRQLVKLS